MEGRALTLCVFLLLGYAAAPPPAEDPFSSSTFECLSNDNCDADKVCKESRCVDPCVGVCGGDTDCTVVDHVAVCACRPPTTVVDPSTTTTTTMVQPSTTPSSAIPSPPCPTLPCNKENKVREKTRRKKFHLNTIVKMNWYSALSFCNAMNSTLATVDSPEEYDTLVSMVKEANGGGRMDYWLSGSDLGQHGQFVWVSTGKPMTYSHWHPGQPDHANLVGEVERCVELLSLFDYHMNDRHCSQPNNVVCQSWVYE